MLLFWDLFLVLCISKPKNLKTCFCGFGIVNMPKTKNPIKYIKNIRQNRARKRNKLGPFKIGFTSRGCYFYI